MIAPGFDPELDRLADLATNSQRWLAEYQAGLSAGSNIPSLKVGYNKVFGYYIEVTNAHKDKAPADWTRKQTTTTSERYITAELKDFEAEAVGARDRAIALEQQLFEQVRQALLPHVATYQELAAAVARVDVLSSLAALAADRRTAGRRSPTTARCRSSTAATRCSNNSSVPSSSPTTSRSARPTACS